MKRIFFILTALLLINGVQAQKETNIWHFGMNTGLDFNQPVANTVGHACWWNGASWSYNYNINISNLPKLINGYVSTFEGCFTISDADGKLIMSSDGSWLYNKNGTVMNSVSLGGNPSATQSGIVIPKPGNPNNYYAVSVTYTRNGPLQYAEIDMSLNGNLGGIISQNNVLTSFNADENIAAIPHSNGIDYWLLHRSGNDYHVWKITASGFNYIGSTPTGSPSTLATYDSVGELIISPDGTRITAMTFDRAELLTANFNSSNGQITNTQYRKFQRDGVHGFYGGCFSPNGEYLYLTYTLLNGNVYDSYCVSWTDLRATGTLQRITPCSNIHRGPDGRLYAIRYNSPMLLVVDNPNSGDIVSQYIPNFFSNTNLPHIGLPTFLSSYLKTNFNVFPLACNQNAREITVEITSGGASPATKIDWDFGDGTIITGQPITPNTTQTYRQIHTYATPGNKTITITPRAADNTAKPSKSFQMEVIPCAIKTNRMIRTNLKDQGEP